jgi:hypothetical protein
MHDPTAMIGTICGVTLLLVLLYVLRRLYALPRQDDGGSVFSRFTPEQQSRRPRGHDKVGSVPDDGSFPSGSFPSANFIDGPFLGGGSCSSGGDGDAGGCVGSGS